MNAKVLYYSSNKKVIMMADFLSKSLGIGSQSIMDFDDKADMLFIGAEKSLFKSNKKLILFLKNQINGKINFIAHFSISKNGDSWFNSKWISNDVRVVGGLTVINKDFDLKEEKFCNNVAKWAQVVINSVSKEYS